MKYTWKHLGGALALAGVIVLSGGYLLYESAFSKAKVKKKTPSALVELATISRGREAIVRLQDASQFQGGVIALMNGGQWKEIAGNQVRYDFQQDESRRYQTFRLSMPKTGVVWCNIPTVKNSVLDVQLEAASPPRLRKINTGEVFNFKPLQLPAGQNR